MMDYCKYTFKIIFTSHTVQYNINKDYTVLEFINDIKQRISNDLQLNQNEFEIVCDQRLDHSTGPSENEPPIDITNECIINKFGKENGFYIRPINNINNNNINNSININNINNINNNISECPICLETVNTYCYYECTHLICSLCYEGCNRVNHYTCSICRARIY